MLGRPTDRVEYSNHWTNESKFLDSIGIYEKLAAQIPDGKVLEVGCGAGFGTARLAKGREVLSIDYNPHLIDIAKRYLEGAGILCKIHK